MPCLEFIIYYVILLLDKLYLSNTVGEIHYKHFKPRAKIGYLKMPKTGSGTTQNILLRYGFKNNLNFVLPKEGIYIGNPQRFHRDMINNTMWEKAGLNYHMFVLDALDGIMRRLQTF